jgi:hypothetical protein
MRNALRRRSIPDVPKSSLTSVAKCSFDSVAVVVRSIAECQFQVGIARRANHVAGLKVARSGHAATQHHGQNLRRMDVRFSQIDVTSAQLWRIHTFRPFTTLARSAANGCLWELGPRSRTTDMRAQCGPTVCTEGSQSASGPEPVWQLVASGSRIADVQSGGAKSKFGACQSSAGDYL